MYCEKKHWLGTAPSTLNILWLGRGGWIFKEDQNRVSRKERIKLEWVERKEENYLGKPREECLKKEKVVKNVKFLLDFRGFFGIHWCP